MGKKKFYVVWHGTEPGVYDTWAECEKRTRGFKGAKFKAFSSRNEAEEAFYSNPSEFIGQGSGSPTCRTHTPAPQTPPMPEDAIAVDAACSGNPGKMEYRGVDLLTGKEIFHYGPLYGTNNIGEFLAVVHALALLKREGRARTVYSDSRNALLWIKKRECRTKLPATEKTATLFSLIRRAEQWLRSNDWGDIPLKKWETKERGEIPADFGRK